MLEEEQPKILRMNPKGGYIVKRVAPGAFAAITIFALGIGGADFISSSSAAADDAAWIFQIKQQQTSGVRADA